MLHLPPRYQRPTGVNAPGRFRGLQDDFPSPPEAAAEAAPPSGSRSSPGRYSARIASRRRKRPDHCQRRRSTGTAHRRSRPRTRRRRKTRPPPHTARGVAGQRRWTLPPHRRQLARAAGSVLQRPGSLRHRRERPLQLHHDQAGRLPVDEPRQRLATGTHPFLAVRHGIHAAPRDADVLPRRSDVLPGPDLQRGTRSSTSPHGQRLRLRRHSPPQLALGFRFDIVLRGRNASVFENEEDHDD